jgi:LysR family transcriptional regulator, transcriptional activator of nhaA
MDWLNYHHLYYFWMVARRGGINAAARELHITPATLSVQIRDLEKSAGSLLLRRDGKTMTLTDTGRAVLEYADQIFTTGRELMELLRGGIASLETLRVGVKDVVPKLVAYEYLKPALAIEPKVRLICREGELDGLLADLSVHRLDLIISDTPIAPTMRVRAYSHLLGESNVVWMGGKGLIATLKRKQEIDWKTTPLLLPMPNTMLRRSIDMWFEKRSVQPFVRGEFDDSAMIKIAAQSGEGLMAVPEIVKTKVHEMYKVDTFCELDGVIERFYAITVARKIKHQAVVKIVELNES